MARNLETSLTIRYKDQLTSASSKALQALAKQSTTASHAVDGIAKSGKALAATVSAPQAVSRAMLELARQSKIAEQALSGASARAQVLGRTPAPTSTIDGLRQMVRQAQLAERSMRALGNAIRRTPAVAASVAAGGAAAGAVLAQPVNKAISYDEQLSRLADTTAAGKPLADKIRVKTEMSTAVENARIYSGGATRESVGEAMNTLVQSGKFDETELPGALKKVSRTAFAAGDDPKKIADLAVAVKQFDPSIDIGEAFDNIFRGGQLGRNEMRDMSKSLPTQFAYAKGMGYSGIKGLQEIVAMNQVAMNTAGGASQAGTNMENLLAKMGSREFSDSISKAVKVRPGDPFTADKKGHKKFDWIAYAQKNREKGINAIESANMLLDRQLAHDKKYQALMAKAAALPEGSERKAAAEGAATMSRGSALGQIIADLQASSGMMGYQQSKKEYDDVMAGMGQSKNAVDQSAEFMGNQTFAKKNLAGGNIDRANEKTFNNLSGSLNDMLDGFNKLSAEYPKLTTAAYVATTALNVLAAAAGAGWLVNVLSGGKIPGFPGGKPAPGANTPGAPAGGVTKPARPIGRAPGLAFGTSVVALASFSTDEENEELTNGKEKWKQLRSQYSQATIDAARKKFQPWYQFGDGYAAENEKWLQQYTKRNVPNPVAPLTQLEGGQQGGYANKLDLAATKMQAAANTPQIVHVKGELRMSGSDLVAAIDQRQTTTARRQ
ncbi:phage tail tape measure protein [Microvirgula aerodenitrificans]|uniref:phage tail tape measure protein n=1 Tax=Microvirgula aerodenitrificans TaxID=57480 RepID=UPI00248E387A|nr:phage tail tape measure protein [Microvirgula aerodenitrificans]